MSKPVKFGQLNDLRAATLRKIADDIVERVHMGELSSLDTHLAAKAMKKICDDILDRTEGSALKEASLYNKGDMTRWMAKFAITNGRTTYDFEQDPEYLQLKNALKAREDVLKNAIKSEGSGIKILTESGEIVQAVPVKSHGSQTIAVTFA